MHKVESATRRKDPPAAGAGWTPTRARLGAAAVYALTLLAYLPTLRLDSVQGDRGQILANSALRSWQAVPGCFTAHVWSVPAWISGVPELLVGVFLISAYSGWLRFRAEGCGRGRRLRGSPRSAPVWNPLRGRPPKFAPG